MNYKYVDGSPSPRGGVEAIGPGGWGIRTLR